jgi:plastocyanin
MIIKRFSCSDTMTSAWTFVIILIIVTGAITILSPTVPLKPALGQVSTKQVQIVSGATSIASQSRITEHNRFYNPAVVSIVRDTEVTWINDDNVVHTVTSGNSASGPTGIFDSGNINPGGRFSWRFTSTSEYYCTLHPFMTGRVIVQ